jgi:protocatechuate 3,4-dioxygenase beta subunit
MQNDDRQVGRILSRREMLVLLGVVGSARLLAVCAPIELGAAQPTATVAQVTPALNAETATALPDCVVRPEMTEGPYFVDEQLNRSDIRLDPTDGSAREGTPLQLTLRVYTVNSSGCTPLEGAFVDIWHCDALGLYSDVQSEGTAGQKFLRGYQVTDANGTVQFTTIYPGWYRGRAVHIHFKVRGGLTANPSYEFTSQFFFDDTLTDQVHAQQPYASKGQRDRRNSQDNIFGSGGDQLLLTLIQSGDGYTTTFDIGLQLS